MDNIDRRMILIMEEDELSYARRFLLVFLLIFGAFVVNTLAGRLLEALKRSISRAIFDQPDATNFVVNIAFDLVNLTFTAVLVWNLHDLCKWMLGAWEMTDKAPT